LLICGCTNNCIVYENSETSKENKQQCYCAEVPKTNMLLWCLKLNGINPTGNPLLNRTTLETGYNSRSTNNPNHYA